MDSRYLPVITRQYSTRVAVDSISRIVGVGRKVYAYADDGMYEYCGKVKDAWQYLNEDVFYSCLERCIINFAKVKVLRGNTIQFQDNTTMALNRDAIARTRRAYNRFIMESCRGPVRMEEGAEQAL